MALINRQPFALPVVGLLKVCLLIVCLLIVGLLSQGCSLVLDFSKPIEQAGPGQDGGLADARSDVSATPDSMPAPACGNSVRDPGESCDDGNQIPLDGCSAQCKEEPGYACTQAPSECAPVSLCPPQPIRNITSPMVTCKSYYEAGYRASGVYSIDVDGSGARAPFDVLCDMSTAGGGWTIVTNNVADAVEPDQCLALLATKDSLTCGTPTCDQDFSLPAYGIPFTELVWSTHPGNLSIGAHNLFQWSTPQVLPKAKRWSLVAEQSNVRLPGFESQPLIGCTTQGAPSLRRISNAKLVRVSGAFLGSSVVTLFDVDQSPITPGNMSLTDVSSSVGLDDFQDGTGCGDQWAPKEYRGAATLIMIR